VLSPLEHCCEKYARTVADPTARALTVAGNCMPLGDPLATSTIELGYTSAGPNQPPFGPLADESNVTVSVVPTLRQIELEGDATVSETDPD
jgi:hypothetical protein